MHQVDHQPSLRWHLPQEEAPRCPSWCRAMEPRGSVTGYVYASEHAEGARSGLVGPQVGLPAATSLSGLATPLSEPVPAPHPSGVATFRGRLTAAYQSGIVGSQTRQIPAPCHPGTPPSHSDLTQPAFHSGAGATQAFADPSSPLCQPGPAPSQPGRAPAAQPWEATGATLSAWESGGASLHPGTTGPCHELSSSWPRQAAAWNQGYLAGAVPDTCGHADRSRGRDAARASSERGDGMWVVPEGSSLGSEPVVRGDAEQEQRESFGQKSKSVDNRAQGRESGGDGADMGELEKHLELLVLKRQVSAARCSAFLQELQAHKAEVDRKAATAAEAQQRHAVSRPRGPRRHARLSRQGASLPKLYAAGQSLHETGQTRGFEGVGGGRECAFRSSSVQVPESEVHPTQRSGVAGGHQLLRKGASAGPLSPEERETGGVGSWSGGWLAGTGSLKERTLSGQGFYRDGLHREPSGSFHQVWGPVSPSLLESHMYYSRPSRNGELPR